MLHDLTVCWWNKLWECLQSIFLGITTNLHLSIAEIASKHGHHDVFKLTPTDIAIEIHTYTQ
jgi:hypothetical protein